MNLDRADRTSADQGLDGLGQGRPILLHGLADLGAPGGAWAVDLATYVSGDPTEAAAYLEYLRLRTRNLLNGAPTSLEVEGWSTLCSSVDA